MKKKFKSIILFSLIIGLSFSLKLRITAEALTANQLYSQAFNATNSAISDKSQKSIFMPFLNHKGR